MAVLYVIRIQQWMNEWNALNGDEHVCRVKDRDKKTDVSYVEIKVN